MAADHSGQCFIPRFTSDPSLSGVAARRPCQNTSCPYLAPSRVLQCTYVCTSADQCKNYNPRDTFPSNRTKMCERCSVPGCSLCESPENCQKCFKDFDLVGGRCVFKRDEEWIDIVKVVEWLAGFAAVALLTYFKAPMLRRRRRLRSVLLRNIKRPLDPWRFHQEVLKLARLHHHWCKVRSWYQAEPDEVPSLMWLCRNPHTTRWLGVGLPLFYNFMIFSFVLMASFFVVYSVYCSNWGHTSLLHQLRNGNLQTWQYTDSQDMCLQWASKSSRDAMQSVAEDMLSDRYRSSFLSCVVLYVVGFVLLANFAHLQKDFAQKSLLKSQSMRWHAVACTGFPRHCVNEVEVKEWLEQFLSERLGRDPSNRLRLATVSICYDAAKYGEAVPKLLDRLITIADVERGAYSHELADTAEEAEQLAAHLQQSIGKGEQELKEGITKDEWVQAARELFEKETCDLLGLDPRTGEVKQRPEHRKPLENDGEVFAVFHNTRDCMEVLSTPGLVQPSISSSTSWRHWLLRRGAKRRLASPRGSSSPRDGSKAVPLLTMPVRVKVLNSTNEPVAVNFHHYGHTAAWRNWRVHRAVIRIVAFQVFLFLLVVVPANIYSLSYEWIVQEAPGGLGSKLYGIFISTSNWLLCVFIAGEVTGAGCLRKDREEVIIFCCFSWMCVSNFLASVAFAFARASAAQDPVIASLDSTGFLLMLGLEERMSEEVFSMLYPGAFVGCLLWPLQGFLWPFLEGFLTLRLMRSDNLTVRKAEKRMEPLPIGLCWDYQGSLTTPVQGFLLLFFSSDIMQWSLLCLSAWPLFFYALQHFNHRRFAKMAMSTTPKLGAWVLASQGIVLGEIAAGAAFWAARAFDWPLYIAPIAFVCGTGLVWAYLTQCVQWDRWPWGKEEAAALAGKVESRTLESTRAKTLYDWINCNPVLVLKSQVVDLRAAGIPPLLPFQVGKTHAWEAQRRSGGKLQTPDTVWYEPGVLFHCCGLVG